ncbi:exonuclease subunit SbcD [Rheinheimera texasensis]|uniref:exonuclease subunit SbcD n=1 Tax=Rheinheimera texasensis TaxID=306205 RepID=UPI000ACF08D6|nr:exonuclease subunit SbcD [Rheinheimera texasensis]
MLRILHTSDWHLGQFFIGKSREAEHRAFFRWLCDTIKTQQIDVMLVAGDIFDTTTPPSYARELYHQLIVDMQPLGAQLVLLGGNHDSVAVLNESAELLRCLNTSVVPGYVTEISNHLLTLHNKAGEPAAVLAAVPFLRPRDLSQRADFRSSSGVEAAEKQLQLQHQISQVYQELYQAALQQADALSPGAPLPVIASGHLTTVGASSTESVREIYIGTLDALPASAFPPFAYIALGHIHQAQKVGGSEFIRYSGSPLALSFDEARQQKYCLLITLDAGTDTNTVQVEALPLPRFQPLCSVKSDLASLPALLTPELQNLADGQRLWLELVLCGDSALLSDVQLQLEQLLAPLPVDLLRLRRERPVTAAGITDSGLSLQELTPADVFAARLAQEELSDEMQQRMEQLHREALDLLQQAESEEQP